MSSPRLEFRHRSCQTGNQALAMHTLSKKTQYSLRALLALSRHYGEGPLLIAEMSRQESIPKKFLEQILLGLKAEGLLESKKGKGGGYALARNPEVITVGQVIRLMEGPLAPLPCASETAYQQCNDCQDEQSCGTRLVMRDVRDAVAGILDHTSLADLCRRSEAARRQAGRCRRADVLHLAAVEGLVEVGDEVVDVFEADREADEVVANSDAGAHIRRDAGVGHGGGMIDERFHAAERFGQSKDLHAAQQAVEPFFAAPEAERECSAEAAHLAQGQLVLRV